MSLIDGSGETSDLILTDRLVLVPIDLGVMAALLAGDVPRAEGLLGVSLPDEILATFTPRRLERWSELLAGRPVPEHWCARLVVLRNGPRVVGHAGFHGHPADVSRAEIGYTVLEADRRQGYATEAVLGLVDWVRDRGVGEVYLSMTPDNAASIGVATKAGFTHVGDQMDPDDGRELVYQLMLRDLPSQKGARNSRFRILPEAFRGRTSTKSTEVGHL